MKWTRSVTVEQQLGTVIESGYWVCRALTSYTRKCVNGNMELELDDVTQKL